MRIKAFSCALLLVTFCTIAFGQRKNKNVNSFKIVGYYFLNAALKDTVHADSNYLFLDKITHLNIAFINPDSAGNFNPDLKIDTFIKKAHEKNVKVLASIAGGGPHLYYRTLLADSNRKDFIHNLLLLVKRYDLDGIDVDLEGNDIDSNYQKFVTELSASLKRKKKLITTAIATTYKDRLPDKALKEFDFINLMAYDETGPWSPALPGDHSPFQKAVDDIMYWHHIRSIPKEKLVLGLPFYGYGFGAIDSPVVTMTYRQIVTQYPDAQLSDTLNLRGNVKMYFNNKAMIKKKTELALNKAGGVMVWQLLGDTNDENSLLNTIFAIIKKARVKIK
jgi:GH18 family chitinase